MEGQIVNDLEVKYENLHLEFKKMIDENRQLKQNDSTLKQEINQLTKGRDSFKEQFLELREINKELRIRFKEIENQVEEWISQEDRQVRDKENGRYNHNK